MHKLHDRLIILMPLVL